MFCCLKKPEVNQQEQSDELNQQEQSDESYHGAVPKSKLSQMNSKCERVFSND